jgi:hypothetical protein
MNLAKIKAHYIKHQDVTSVGVGLKQVGGSLTEEKAIVFGVTKKKPPEEVEAERLLPRSLDDLPTDVVETGVIKALALVDKRRPCPPGYSVGHVAVSAGTLGGWFRDQDGSPLMLSNNHVLANSNRSLVGDDIIQPGKADGGFSASDRIGRLDRFVGINFHAKEKSKGAELYWKLAKSLPNALAKATGCPYRLEPRVPTLGLPQPTPNLVDAAVAKPLNPDISKDTPFVGEFKGLGTAALGGLWLRDLGHREPSCWPSLRRGSRLHLCESDWQRSELT